MRKTILTAVLLTLVFQAGHTASAGIQKEIEKRQSDCVEKDPSTAGMTRCSEAAYEEWDRELNNSYKRLLKAIPEEEGKAKVKEAQRAWLKFRDQEFKCIDAVYAGMEGTMYIPMHAESRLRVVRERALLLGHYAELAESGK